MHQVSSKTGMNRENLDHFSNIDLFKYLRAAFYDPMFLG
jgi:hypothetical protein